MDTEQYDAVVIGAGAGGLSAGAGERLAATNAAAGLREKQTLRRQGQQAQLGIASQDEQRKLQLAQGLSGQTLALGAENRQGFYKAVRRTEQDQGYHALRRSRRVPYTGYRRPTL